MSDGRAQPTVSVVIPSYNYAGFLPETLESVLAQTVGTTIEIVVIDDASTDATWETISRYRSDPRVVAVLHERNRGYVATYNEGMALARGRFIVSLDADDLVVDPGAFAMQAEILDREPDVGLVSSASYVIDESGQRIGTRRPRVPSRMPSPAGARRLLVGNFIMHSGAMTRRRIVGELGGYDDRFFHSMDWEFWLRIASRHGLAHVDRCLYAYRIHTRNMHRSVVRDTALVEWMAIVERGSELLNLPPGSRLRQRAIATGYVERSRMHASRSEYRSTLSDLGTALRTAPSVVFGRAGLVSLGHLAAGAILGDRKSAVLDRLRRRGAA